MQLETKEQYTEARAKCDAYQAAAAQWMADNKTNGIPAEIWNTFPYANEVTNELRSAVEVYEFCADKPQKYFLYISEDKRIATTWTGDKLGTIILRPSYRSGFGDIRQTVIVHAINGLTYTGTYYKSSGDYARVTAKHSKTA